MIVAKDGRVDQDGSNELRLLVDVVQFRHIDRNGEGDGGRVPVRRGETNIGDGVDEDGGRQCRGGSRGDASDVDDVAKDGRRSSGGGGEGAGSESLALSEFVNAVHEGLVRLGLQDWRLSTMIRREGRCTRREDACDTLVGVGGRGGRVGRRRVRSVRSRESGMGRWRLYRRGLVHRSLPQSWSLARRRVVLPRRKVDVVPDVPQHRRRRDTLDSLAIHRCGM